MRIIMTFVVVGCLTSAARGQDKPPVHLWFEPEWFEGVKGSFNYWTGAAKPTGSWGIAGPGISAEWSQGGESEWNSIGAAAAETQASCRRAIVVPRTGTYKVWVRYVDHRNQAAPFRVTVEQNGRPALSGELGVKPVLPPNDEYQLFWGFAFGWDALDGKLEAGPARLVRELGRPASRRVVEVALVVEVERNHLGPPALHLEGPVAVPRTHVQRPEAVHPLGQPEPVHERPVVPPAVGHVAGRELERVVPAARLSALQQIL